MITISSTIPILFFHQGNKKIYTMRLLSILLLCLLIALASAQTGAPFTFLKLIQKPNATAEYKLVHPMLDGKMKLTQMGTSYSSDFQTNCTWIEKSFQMGQLFKCTYYYCYRLEQTDVSNRKLYLMGKYYRCPNLVSVRYFPNGVLHFAEINGTAANTFTYTGNSVTNYEILGNSSTTQAHTYDIRVSIPQNTSMLQLPGNFSVIQVDEKINGTLKQTAYWNGVHGLLAGSQTVLTNITYPADPVIPKPEISRPIKPPTNSSSSTSVSLVGFIATILFVILSCCSL